MSALTCLTLAAALVSISRCSRGPTPARARCGARRLAVLARAAGALTFPTLRAGPLAHPLTERVGAAHEIARLLERSRELALLRRLSHGLRGLADLLFQRVEIGADVLLEALCVLGRLALDHAFRVPDHLLDLVVADRSGRVLQLA